MTWIVDIDVVAVEATEVTGALAIYFDVTYPGETWCRCLVMVSPEVAQGPENTVVSLARDALVAILEAAGEPLSVELELTPAGTTVVASGRPGG